ncbi:MAG: GNAT family N-acetyltransferase [Erythrobacter sp.]|nr:GNAT family N-acetyltransferase [Erythrobacter sp.]
MAEVEFRWNHPDDVAPAAAFAGDVIARSAAYISHGEVQTGLSDDGKTWVPNLAELYAQDFADPGDRDMLVGRDGAGRVVAFLIVAWEASSRRAFAVIEDMAVEPDLRGQGLGSRLIALAEQRISERGIEWVFLESGLGNEGAHQLFERAGFAVMSKVFGRRLSD